MKIGNKEFDTAKHTYIMGILNVTPDSFSDGGKWNGYDAAMRHAEELLEGGTDILDIGGESTRPGHQQITSEEEITRTAPVIEACIRKRMLSVPKCKYRNVRDQRWGKCIFLSIAIRPNKKIRYSLLFVEVISYLFFYPLYFARNCAISSMQPSTSFSSATSAGICI